MGEAYSFRWCRNVSTCKSQPSKKISSKSKGQEEKCNLEIIINMVKHERARTTGGVKKGAPVKPPPEKGDQSKSSKDSGAVYAKEQKQKQKQKQRQKQKQKQVLL
jgi:hypothetical protein